MHYSVESVLSSEPHTVYARIQHHDANIQYPDVVRDALYYWQKDFVNAMVFAVLQRTNQHFMQATTSNC